MICRMDYDMVFGILIFDPKRGFCKGCSPCMRADFQNGVISPIFSVFWSSFLAQNIFKGFVKENFDVFFGILICNLKWGFCKGHSLCVMADLKMLSLLKYLVFFEAVFFREKL